MFINKYSIEEGVHKERGQTINTQSSPPVYERGLALPTRDRIKGSPLPTVVAVTPTEREEGKRTCISIILTRPVGRSLSNDLRVPTDSLRFFLRLVRELSPSASLSPSLLLRRSLNPLPPGFQPVHSIIVRSGAERPNCCIRQLHDQLTSD